MIGGLAIDTDRWYKTALQDQHYGKDRALDKTVDKIQKEN
jgi:hypothetical protein